MVFKTMSDGFFGAAGDGFATNGFFFGLHCRVWPYKSASDNRLKAFAEGQLVLTLFISVVLRTQLEDEPVSSNGYGTILVLAFFAAPSYEIVLLLRSLWEEWRKRVFQVKVKEDGDTNETEALPDKEAGAHDDSAGAESTTQKSDSDPKAADLASDGDGAEEELRASSVTPEPDEFEHIVPQQPRSSPTRQP